MPKSKSMGPAFKASDLPILQVKITLKDIAPPVWRRLLVPGSISLFEFHWDIQRAMGWQNCHLHQFLIDDDTYSPPNEEDEGHEKSSETVCLARFADREGREFVYEYDFGDGWEHDIVIEKILPPDSKQTYSICLDGKRACPPEDCGGPYGYEDLLKALHNPKHPEHKEMKRWVGRGFDPEFFDLKSINRDLKKKVPVDAHFE